MKRQHLQKKRGWFAALAMGTFTVAWLAAFGATADVPTYYWDVNGSDPGAGSDLSAVWSNSSLTWTTDTNGDSATFAYDTRANIVFSATGDPNWTDTPDYTVSILGTAHVSDITIQDGNVTLTNITGVLDKDTPNITVLNFGQTATIYSPITSATGTSNGLTKVAYGNLVLAGTNTYQGPTTIQCGQLNLGASQVLPKNSMLILVNGDGQNYQDTPATLFTGGFNQTMGPLQLQGDDPTTALTVDFNYSHSALAFADSHDQNWNGMMLTVANFIPGVSSLRFGTNASGLTATQLQQIQFPNFVNSPGQIDAHGYVTPSFPQVISVVPQGPNSYLISWTAFQGGHYMVQYKVNLDDNEWVNDESVTVNSGTVGTFLDTSVTDSHRFYRIRLLPPQPPS